MRSWIHRSRPRTRTCSAAWCARASSVRAAAWPSDTGPAAGRSSWCGCRFRWRTRRRSREERRRWRVLASAVGRFFYLSQLFPPRRHVAQDREDHGYGGQGRRAPRAGEVVEPDLDDAAAGLARPEQELGVDEAALAGQGKLLQHGPAEELEGEVHVADAQAEQRADEVVVAERVEGPHEALGRAVEPIAGDHVRLLVLEQAHRSR